MLIHINCPNCGNRLEYESDNLIAIIRIPEDEDYLIQTLKRKLNSSICKICNWSIQLDIPLLYREGKQIVVYINEMFPADCFDEAIAEIKQETGNGISVFTVNRREELNEKVFQLLNNSFAANFTWLRQIFSTDADKDLNRQEFIHQVSPFLLRLLKCSLDGYIKMQIINPEITGAAYQKTLRDFYEIILLQKIKFLVLESAREKTLHDLPAIFEEELPVECITDNILERYADSCLFFQDMFQDGFRFMVSWRDHFSNAVLHAHVKKPNPKVSLWTQQYLMVEMVNEQPNVQLDPLFLLPTPLVKLTLPFESLWDQMVIVLNHSEDKEAIFQFFFNLFKKIEYTDDFERIGNDGIWHISVDPAMGESDRSIQIEKIVNNYYQIFRNTLEKKVDSEKDEAGLIKSLLPSIINPFFKSQLPEAAFLFSNKFRDDLARVKKFLCLVAASTVFIELYNRYRFYEESLQLVQEIYPVLSDPKYEIPEALFYPFVNECGNTFRYLRQFKMALQFYDLCEEVLVQLKEKEAYAQQDYYVLIRNKAIVFREQGKYVEALKYFDKVRSVFNNDPEFNHNLATIYLELNILDEALNFVNKSIGLTKGSLTGHAGLNYLITRSIIWCRMNEFESGLDDLQYLMGNERAGKDLQTRAANAVLMYFPVTDDKQPVFETARTIALDNTRSTKGFMINKPTSFFALTNYYVKRQNTREALETLEAYQEYLGEGFDNINEWMFQHLLALTGFLKNDYVRCWDALKKAMAQIISFLTKENERYYVDTWQFDKHQFKNDLARMAMQMHQEGNIRTIDLVSVYEFNNGLEITVKLDEQEEFSIDIDTLMKRLDPQTAYVFFYDHAEKVSIIGMTAERGAFLIDGITFEQEEVIRIKNLFHNEIKEANPADPGMIDEATECLFNLVEPLCRILRTTFPKVESICFLPGNTFSNFPLHLMRTGKDDYLFQKYCLYYCPNLHILVSEYAKEQNPIGNVSIACIPKRSDNPFFIQKLNDLLSGLQHNRYVQNARVVRDGGADLKTLIALLEDSEEMILLCHGTFAGPLYGNAICVSYENDLPPGFLPIKYNPGLKNYLLTWKDLSKANRTPAIVVTIACSSAQVTLKEAGVRYGLEQALFSSGTHTIISPFWDIRQLVALEFIRRFYELRGKEPSLSLVRQYHAAILGLKAEYKHFYYWGAIGYNGKIINQ